MLTSNDLGDKNAVITIKKSPLLKWLKQRVVYLSIQFLITIKIQIVPAHTEKLVQFDWLVEMAKSSK